MINIPIAIIAVAMASIGLIDSPRVAIAIMIPIMGVNESAIIVFIVPILLSPSKRKNNAPANPKMASIEITIHSDVSMLSRALVKAVTEGLLNTSNTDKTIPPIRNFSIAIFEGSTLDFLMRRLLKLLSNAQHSIAPRISIFPGSYSNIDEDNLSSVEARNNPAITIAMALYPQRPLGLSPKNTEDKRMVNRI